MLTKGLDLREAAESAVCFKNGSTHFLIHIRRISEFYRVQDLYSTFFFLFVSAYFLELKSNVMLHKINTKVSTENIRSERRFFLIFKSNLIRFFLLLSRTSIK